MLTYRNKRLFLCFSVLLLWNTRSFALDHAPTAPENDPAVSKYDVVAPGRKTVSLGDRFDTLLNYEPKNVEKVPFGKVEDLIKKVRAQADQGNHQYALFDITDGCFLRNELFKRDLAKANVNLEKSTASLMIKYLDKTKKWSFHSVSVIYTDKGPMVFDPDIKDVEQRFAGNLITPLSTWLQVDWSHMKPVYTLAPPDYTHIRDYLNTTTVFPHAKPGAAFGDSFWSNFDGATPNSPIFQDVKAAPHLSDAQISRDIASMSYTIAHSRSAFNQLKKGH